MLPKRNRCTEMLDDNKNKNNYFSNFFCHIHFVNHCCLVFKIKYTQPEVQHLRCHYRLSVCKNDPPPPFHVAL